jgi:hypothetical protein
MKGVGNLILQNKELGDICKSPTIVKLEKSRRIRWVGQMVRMGETINACRKFGAEASCKIFTWKTENIKMGLKETCCEDGRWMEQVQHRVE